MSDSGFGYVKFLRDSAPYINTHRGKTFVLALSGDAVAHPNFTSLIHDIALLTSLGIKLVLVHGARQQIDARLTRQNIATAFARNIRITDNTALDCVKDAVGNTRIGIESKLSMGGVNSPMQGAQIRVAGGNFITAKPLGIRDGIDYQHTGEVRKVDRDSIQKQLDDGAIVLLSSLGYSPTGETFNLCYEDVATQTAIALKAEKLMVFASEQAITDTSGNLKQVISLHEVHDCLKGLFDNSPLYMALLACYQACENGVSRGHIISFSEDGSLLSELFTREGSGTLILRNGSEVIRQATIDDIGGLLDLIEPLESEGVLVKRSREILETEVSRFMVMQHSEGMLVGCAALYPFANGKSAELACLATHPDFHNQGFATRMLEQIEQHAKKHGINQLFVLTTQAAHWFQEKGFAASSLTDLPVEKQSLYNFQRNSKIFMKQL